MTSDERQLGGPRDAWRAYREMVERWFAASSGQRSTAEIDDVTHELVAKHEQWSDALRALILFPACSLVARPGRAA